MAEKNFSIKKHNKSIVGKIIITCLLACAAIFLSLFISKFTFSKILSTVGQLSKPNLKIRLVNDLFRNVVQLDQLQRNEAMQANKIYNPFLKESKSIQDMLDSLRTLSRNNQTQIIRIDSMKKIMYKRDILFLKYLKFHTHLVQNDTLAQQIKNLSGLIENAQTKLDSTVVTTSKSTKTIIDTINDEKKQSLWSRVFAKNKKHPKQVQKKIEEELKVRVDTVKLGASGDNLAKAGKTIAQVETNRLSQRSLLLKREAELNVTGNTLIGQLISILNDIENDELLRVAQQNAAANDIVDKGILNISAVFFISLLTTIVLAVLIFTDISRGNRYRRQLVIAKEAAEEAGRVKQRFLANMSHELRTPLQTIVGVSEQVVSHENPRRQDLENIHQSSLHLLQIVNEVLDYSRIISGKYVIDCNPFNMRSLLEEVREMIQVQLTLKRLALDYDIAINPDNWYIGDSFRLKQILLNVLGNAIKFTGSGCVSFFVKEQSIQGGDSLFTFIIKDTGIGITTEQLAVIFNEFEQGGNAQQRQGTGLGLSIVKAMVDIQHGSISAESVPGIGATFTILLPYGLTAKPADENTILQAGNNYTGHVWVVDDDLFILQLCDDILSKHNIAHTCFSSPLKANDTPFPNDISIVFLDVRMADMDGITLCGKLKERQPPNPPVYIAITAQAFPEERHAILQKGFDALVVKPFLERDFINAIYGHSGSIEENQPVDLSTIRKMVGDDAQAMARALQSFVSETEQDINTVIQSLDNNDSSSLAEALHRLAGRCGQVGAIALSAKFRTMEIALRKGENIDAIAIQAKGIYPDVNALIATLKK